MFDDDEPQYKPLSEGIVCRMGNLNGTLSVQDYLFQEDMFSEKSVRAWFEATGAKHDKDAEIITIEEDIQMEKFNHQLTEAIKYTGKINKDEHTINDVFFAGIGESANKLTRRDGMSYSYEYLPSALKDAVSMYEGVPVYIDHVDGGEKHRKVAAKFGKTANARFVEGKGIYGDIVFNPKHTLTEQVLWLAENMPEELGCSHIADGVLRKRGNMLQVSKINTVKSVDLVAESATTTTLFEGVIADRIKEQDKKNRLSRISNTAFDLIFNELYSSKDDSGIAEDIVAIAADLIKEAEQHITTQTKEFI